MDLTTLYENKTKVIRAALLDFDLDFNLDLKTFCRTQEGPAYTWLFNFRSDRPSAYNQNCKQLLMYMNNWDKGVALAFYLK